VADVMPKVFVDCPDCPEMVVIPAGGFDMGGGEEDNEMPLHHVTISRSFAMGKTEITQGQWRAVMGNNPSHFSNSGDNFPVEKVSWDDAQAFIQKLSARTGKKYRLPAEAEWEYACRAGAWDDYCGSNNVASVAWYGAFAKPVGTSSNRTNPVARKQANAFGLYDMSGNVTEWVEDNFHENYNGAPTDGSVWAGSAKERVVRGGSWGNTTEYVRAAFRHGFEPGTRSVSTGFRVARALP